MRRTLTRGLVLLPLLISSQVVAQVTPNQVPERTDGRSLGAPHHQQQANDAMNTPSGRAGRDEPGAHAPTRNEPPVLKNGVLDVPGGTRASPSAPDQTSGQRP
jgi:hypothetical protein